MSLNIQDYERKPFPVKAVQVTEENMAEVKEWCKGTLVNFNGNQGRGSYIAVPAYRALNERQTQAHVTDYVVFTNNQFKVYTEQSFNKTFARAAKKRKGAGDAINKMAKAPKIAVTSGQAGD
jgi:hypothetical protein